MDMPRRMELASSSRLPLWLVQNSFFHSCYLRHLFLCSREQGSSSMRVDTESNQPLPFPRFVAAGSTKAGDNTGTRVGIVDCPRPQTALDRLHVLESMVETSEKLSSVLRYLADEIRLELIAETETDSGKDDLDRGADTSTCSSDGDDVDRSYRYRRSSYMHLGDRYVEIIPKSERYYTAADPTICWRRSLDHNSNVSEYLSRANFFSEYVMECSRELTGTYVQRKYRLNQLTASRYECY